MLTETRPPRRAWVPAITLIVVAGVVGPAWPADLPVPAAAASSPPFLVDAQAPGVRTADECLARLVAGLPREPLLISGDLWVRRRRGIVVRKLQFEMALEWGQTPSRARYTLRDAFGSDLEQLLVTRDADGSSRLAYASGSPLAAAALPDLYAPVQGTDLTWTDLTLSFLWWRGGVLVGREEIRGRPCHVLEISAPDGTDDYAKVRLWVDEAMSMLLQAEAYDADGHLVRRLWIQSFRKIGDRWMIKDLEVEQFPSVHRTKLRVGDVVEAEAP